MKEAISSEKALKEVLEKGEWYQCQGVPELYENKEVDEQLREAEGHAIFHLNEDGKIDLLFYATRSSLGKRRTRPSYHVTPKILPRVKRDLANLQGHERCPTCQFLLKIHQEGGNFSKRY